jgi:phage terminase large subunit-like protein
VKDFCKIADAYIDDVLSNKFVTNQWTKLACQRQRNDIARQSSEEFPYYFNKEAAENVCNFLELLTHVHGELGGQRFVMEPWQCFYITTVFGWINRATGLRRFRRAFLECGKGQGKSFISSGVALYMLMADNQPGAEVIAAARATDQARLVFDTSREMCRANPSLCEAFGIEVQQHTILQKSTASVMKPVSAAGKTLAGKRPHYASVDETWSHKTREVLDEMQRGCDKMNNSLLSTITHAGGDLSSIGYEQHVTATKILLGELKDERTFCIIYSAEGFEWASDDAMRAANPNLGVSVYEETLREERDRALKTPSLRSMYQSHNLCLWINADSVWIDPVKLAACRQANLKMEDFKFWHPGEIKGYEDGSLRRPFVLGMDLASRQDLASVAYICIGFPNGPDAPEHFYCWTKNYLPEETIAGSPISAYRGWATRGLITAHEGPSLRLEGIQEDILANHRQSLGFGTWRNESGYQLEACAYDEWQAAQMVGNLNTAGIKAIPFQKNAKNYSPTMDLFTSLVLEGRFHFAAQDEPLLWCLSNVVAHRDNNDNLFPKKADKDPKRKIDCAIALLYALRVAMAENGKFVRYYAPAPLIRVLDMRKPYTGEPNAPAA